MSTLYPYLAAFGIIFVLMTGWVLVQLAWKKCFPEAKNEDAMAGRAGCCGCALEEYCENRDAEPDGDGTCRLDREQVSNHSTSASVTPNSASQPKQAVVHPPRR
jgi:hypothetical protein